MIPTRRGNHILMINQYTFAKDNRSLNYYCSKKGMDCKARVKMNPDGVIVKAFLTHNHDPPKYIITSKGEYVKLT
jgi:hypothetical protein